MNETYKEKQFATAQQNASTAYSQSSALKSDVDGIIERFGDTEKTAVFTSGYYLNQSGVRVANSTESLRCSDYIEVSEGDVVKYKGVGGTANAMLCTYDNDKKFVKCDVAHTGAVLEGEVTIKKGVKYIVAHSTTSTDYYCKVKSFGYKKLSDNVKEIKEGYDETFGNYYIKPTWKDLGANLAAAKYEGNGTKTIEADGVKFADGSDTQSSYWVGLGIVLPKDFVFGHKYFVAINLNLIEDTTAPTSGSTQGNKTYDSIDLRNRWNTNTVITATKQTLNAIITKGNTSTLKWIFDVAESGSYTGSEIRLQFGSYNNGNRIEYKVKSVCVIDMTTHGLESIGDAEAAFAKYGYNHADIVEKVYNIKVKSAVDADNAGSGGGSVSKGNIEIWGDSLVGQGYGTTYLAPMLGRTVITKGYGGKESTYIREQFLAQANTDNTIIINVGRNNYQEWYTIKNDIARMLSIVPHSRFLICMPPTGHYGEGLVYDKDGNLVEGAAYKKFKKLRDVLQREYQSNFLDTWHATIEEFDNGGVTLTQSFVKPALGSSVNIAVSSASYLTTYNSGDTGQWGEEFMKQIVIGKSIDAVDVYKVNSADGNTLNCTLVKSGSDFKVGDTVDNWHGSYKENGTTIVDSSIKYLVVMQYADYDCYIKEVTQSTFRQDGVHMNDRGQKCLAKVIARKITQMGI